ncbi:uncharacterized protein K489DRAFT_414108 [Dissoconium aciculare CBS 342.82]|uniref:Uncharacterized protein n=1 Tax=Dissoconium aciculare CBS 342.82 TaxID=1314786 RepID=A0A6J3LRZ2_9PEZI|nr:uncharacterized protein K489DRAFT_414108 [Dissoconium aciculare CBS 342.82]KAF1818054.1 hypothetical protein K489DRAFT_414108 [Dissoconium aciculare CBS 342.82]
MCGPTEASGIHLTVPITEGDIKSFDLVKYHEAAKEHETSEEKDEFLTQLLSTKGGRAWVAEKVTATLVPAVFGYAKKQEHVKATVACALFWMKVTVEANGSMGVQTGHSQLGGLFSAGGGVYWGTLFFDNSDDINNATSTMVVGLGPSITVTFFRPNGHAVGVYQGGGVSTCSGTGGSTWSLGP